MVAATVAAAISASAMVLLVFIGFPWFSFVSRFGTGLPGYTRMRCRPEWILNGAFEYSTSKAALLLTGYQTHDGLRDAGAARLAAFAETQGPQRRCHRGQSPGGR